MLIFFCERVLGCNWDLGFLRVFLCTIVFSQIIVKLLQLRGRRQIAEPRKYCLVRVIVFFDVCFLYLFCFSQVVILVKFPTILGRAVQLSIHSILRAYPMASLKSILKRKHSQKPTPTASPSPSISIFWIRIATVLLFKQRTLQCLLFTLQMFFLL